TPGNGGSGVDEPDTVRVFGASRGGVLHELTATTIQGAPVHEHYGHREMLVAEIDGRKGSELLVLRVVSTAPGELRALRVDGTGQLVADGTPYGFAGED